MNNRAVVAIDGVRDKLRVLLVSGEPHSGERTWRNLLKSDASRRSRAFHHSAAAGEAGRHADQRIVADRVSDPRTVPAEDQRIPADHLRPLRPPGRAADRLFRQHRALCARRRRGAGRRPAPTTPRTTSIWRTPLDTVLPAEPVGVTEKPFYAQSDRRRQTPSGDARARRLRQRAAALEPVLPHRSTPATPPARRSWTGADGKPLLLLSRYGEGRVALLLSDHIWLWARGYEGGGPHLDLLRRMSHWLMKQPDLDEEALRLQVQGQRSRRDPPDHGRQRRAGDGDLAERRHARADAVVRPSPACGARRCPPTSSACGRRPTAR